MAGRPPKPVEQHLREGTFRKDRHELPVVIGGRREVEVPSHLSASQRTLWEIVVDDMRDSNVLDNTDRWVVEGFVVAVATARDADRVIREEGMIVLGTRGLPMKHPAVTIRKEAWAQAFAFAQQLGLTPAARAKLGLMAVSGMTATKKLEDMIGPSPVGKDK